MRTLLILLAAAALWVAPAHAYHSDGYHWPGPGTVAANGGGCSQPCVWLRLIDRTGLGPGTAWRDTVRTQVVGKLKAAMPIPLQVTWQNGSRFNLWTPDGQTHTAEAFALTPVGAVFIGWNAASAARTSCHPGGDPYQPPPTYSYCRDDPFHISRAVVAVGGDGVGPNALNATATHELGHALGLTHRIVNANGNCDGQSAMCAFGYLNFDAHDKAELATRYGHTP